MKTYTWDLDNRLRSVSLPGGDVYSYEYDANGLRTKQVTRQGVNRYLLDGSTVLVDVDVDGTTSARYLSNPQVIDDILAFERDGVAYCPMTDALGSIYSVSDSSGAVVRSFSYDVYGERAGSGVGLQFAFGYAGREHDMSGLRYQRDRYVDALTGRWTQPDRLGMVDGPNLYGYVKGSPTQFIDPTGQNTIARAVNGLFAAIAVGDVPTAMY